MVWCIVCNIRKKNNREHSSTKSTPIQVFSKKSGGFVHNSWLDKRKKLKPKFQENDLVRAADLNRTFSKGDTTNWSNLSYKNTEDNIDTIPSYDIDKLPERYNETLLKKR